MNHAVPNQQKTFGHILGQQYTVFDGLAGMYVEDIYQDRHGLLWVGTTDGGVSRFDGAHFDTFGLSDGLPHLTVTTIVEDADGRLLIRESPLLHPPTAPDLSGTPQRRLQMRSFRSMKYQILAAVALLLSGPYIAAAADPADQPQWSESVPVDEERYPGERVEAYIVDGLLHARRLDQDDTPPFGTSFSPKLIRNNPLRSNT